MKNFNKILKKYIDKYNNLTTMDQWGIKFILFFIIYILILIILHFYLKN